MSGTHMQGTPDNAENTASNNTDTTTTPNPDTTSSVPAGTTDTQSTDTHGNSVQEETVQPTVQSTNSDLQSTVVPNVDIGASPATINSSKSQRYVQMPGSGLYALAQELYHGDTDNAEKMNQHVLDLFELNKDLLPNTLSFLAGQMIRIPSDV